MKVFIQIFTIYLFSLTIAPCGEGGGIIGIFTFLSEQETLTVEQHENPCEDAPCSPFCICSCCIPILDTPKTEMLLPERKSIPTLKEALSYYASYLPSSFHKDIWQPPKLS
jgi:hypothetical protein